MTPNEALHLYTAIKLHFSNPSYDFFKYQGKVKNKLDYTKRNDKFQLQKIAKHSDPLGLLVSNLSANPSAWAGDIISDTGLKIYREWQKRQESLSYTFTEELKKFDKILEKDFRIVDHQHPKALRLYLGSRISLDTLAIINTLAPFWKHWDNNLKDDLAWKSMRLVIPKYQPFLKFDRAKFLGIIKSRYTA